MWSASMVVRDALARGRPTALTRAFTGRWARDIRNRFLDQHTATAPSTEIHYATSPLRTAARERSCLMLHARRGLSRFVLSRCEL